MMKELEKLGNEELSGVLTMYPWFAQARKELCLRACREGDWGLDQIKDVSYYISDARVLNALYHNYASARQGNGGVLSRASSHPASQPAVRASQTPSAGRPAPVPGGDYFSSEQYAAQTLAVKLPGLRGANPPSRPERPASDESTEGLGIYTETLARIYEEQGYYRQAMDIYAKLILVYPQKSAYFASLIAKLEEKTDKIQ